MSDPKIIILSVCDTERELLAHLLMSDGLASSGAVTPDEAIELAGTGEYGLIIVDTLFWTKGAVDGLRYIKRHSKAQAMPCMMFGPVRSQDEVVHAVQAGASTWVLRKGFRLEMFIEKVRTLLQNVDDQLEQSPQPQATQQAAQPNQAQPQAGASKPSESQKPEANTAEGAVSQSDAEQSTAEQSPQSAVAETKPEQPAAEAQSEASAGTQETPEAAESPKPASNQQQAAGKDVSPLTEDRFHTVMTDIGDLPAFEFNLTEAITTTCAKSQQNDHMAGIVRRDPMLALSLLSRAGQIDSEDLNVATGQIDEIVAALGNREFYRLVESMPTINIGGNGIWDAGQFWMHSVGTSKVAGVLSQLLGIGRPAEVEKAGLLHDVGYFVMANYFPHHFNCLFAASRNSDSLSADWEQQLTGVDHGQLGAWTMKRFGLPESLQDAAALHHAPMDILQSAKASSRVLALLVQAADALTYALFPGDPPLMSLGRWAPEFDELIDRSNSAPGDVLEETRKVTADLLTEMLWLFPQSNSKPYYYNRPPISQVLYFAPGKRLLDVVKVFLDTRAEEVKELGHLRDVTVRSDLPLVVNLMHVNDIATQVETLTSLVAVNAFKSRRSVVLMGPQIQEQFRNLLPDACRLVASPSHPARWFRWLADSAPLAEPKKPKLSVVA